MVFIGIIPARFASTRFPGKPLADIHGKPMIQHVYEKAAISLEHVWVATDDQRIFNAVNGFGGNVIFTSPDHKSGTDRVAEAAQKLSQKFDFDIAINIQGDEPFLDPAQIEAIKQCFDGETEIATLVRKINSEDELLNPNKPKVVIDGNHRALYFSRSPIPYVRDANGGEWIKKTEFWAHIGMYAYTKEVLQKLAKLPQGKLEKAESLEQLRWLENGFQIKTAVVNSEAFGIDTPEDLGKALKLFS
jgi:3-deoxy-manno-octulosonate cytidylyltransferase (CMP-KDO synthetase)